VFCTTLPRVLFFHSRKSYHSPFQLFCVARGVLTAQETRSCPPSQVISERMGRLRMAVRDRIRAQLVTLIEYRVVVDKLALEKVSLQLSSLLPAKPDSAINPNSSTLPDHYFYAWHPVVFSTKTNEKCLKNCNINFIIDNRNCQFL